MIELDWWSKYYASTGDRDKCMNYLEQGYDTLQACTHDPLDSLLRIDVV